MISNLCFFGWLCFFIFNFVVEDINDCVEDMWGLWIRFGLDDYVGNL